MAKTVELFSEASKVTPPKESYRVVIVKLSTNEELIAKLVDSQSNQNNIFEKSIAIKEPLGLMPNPETGKIALYPWSVGTAKRNSEMVIYINHSAIIAIMNSPEDLEEQYVAFVSGLHVPTQAERSIILK